MTKENTSVSAGNAGNTDTAGTAAASVAAAVSGTSAAPVADPRPLKTTQDSATETTRILQYRDINGENRLFGGKIMEWIDEAATITAMRHCECNITTACVDTLRFKKGAFLNDLVVICAKLTYVGRTSMEVRVDSYVEDRETGRRDMINHAYLTMVAVDAEGHPVPVKYGLQLSGETEKLEADGALRRRKIRTERNAEGF